MKSSVLPSGSSPSGTRTRATITKPATAGWNQRERTTSITPLIRPPSRARRTAPSSGLPRLLAEQPLRLEDHDQDQVGEHDHGGPVAADPAVGELLDDPDDEAAEHRAAEVADAAHDGGGERDEAGAEALEEPHLRLVERVDEAGGARQQAAQQERERDRGVDVDAHEPRGLGVLSGRAHRLAEPAARDEGGEQDHERDRDPQRQRVLALEADPADREDLL